MDRRRMTLRGRGKEKDQFEVQQPTVANVLDQLQTRSGKSYQRTPAVKKAKSIPTLYVANREELEERQRLLSPSRTPSTEAIDTEEGVEMTQYIKKEALQRERRTASVKLHRLRGEEYDIPRPLSIPLPDIQRRRDETPIREDNLSLRTNRDYEELDRFSRSATQTPRYFDQTIKTDETIHETVKKPDITSKGSAFVDYKTAVLDKLDKRVATPREKRVVQRKQMGDIIPPLVFGITPEGSSDEKGKFTGRFIPEGYIPMTNPSTPEWTKEAPVSSTVEALTQFTQTIQGNPVITVPAMTLVTDQVKTTPSQKQIEPDFYLPDGKGSRLSQLTTYKVSENSPEGNPAVIVKIPNLAEKYGTDKYLLDRYSGHLFMTNQQGIYTCIEEKGWIYPTESSLMEPIAGSSQGQSNVTPQSIQLSNFKKTPEAESTRDPLMASPKFNKEAMAEAISQEVMDSISLMMGIRKRKQDEGSASGTPKEDDTLTTSITKPKEIVEEILDLGIDPEETQRTSSLDLQLKMIEEQKQLEKIAREKAMRMEQEKREARERDEEQEKRIAEEARRVQLELEQAQKERLIMENERLRLLAAQEEMEKQRKLDEKRIEEEQRARQQQQFMAEQALVKLEEKRKQTINYYEKVRKDTPDIEVDEQIEEEIDKMKDEMVGPDGQMEETKMPQAAQMSRYPSMESVETNFIRPYLTRKERRDYEQKKRVIDAKMEIAHTVLVERTSLAETKEQLQLFRTEHASICDELQRRRRICQDILCRPNFTPPGYPDPFEMKTPPPRALTSEEFEYYFGIQEKLERWDRRATGVYVDRLKDIETPEEREQVYKDQERYVAWSDAMRAKIKYAFQLKDTPTKDLKKDPEQDQEEGQNNEYLELEQPNDTPNVHQISRKELDLMFGTGISPTPQTPSPQKAMDEKISEVLKESRVATPRVTTPLSDYTTNKKEKVSSEEKPLPQREKIRKVHESPIGGNTIPIRYSKEIGRYGGIERPTSTEARQSQDDAVQAVKKFRTEQGAIPHKERSVSLNGAPVEELDWDYHDGTVQVPVTRSKETAPDVVLGIPKEVNRRNKGDNSFRERDSTMRRKKFTSLRPYKEVVSRQIKQGQRVTTLLWPTSPKIYKRKIGDPSGKLYSDEAIYGDEKDDMFAKGMPNSDEIDLFDTICEWCKGDHLVIYCPYKQERSPIR